MGYLINPISSPLLSGALLLYLSQLIVQLSGLQMFSRSLSPLSRMQQAHVFSEKALKRNCTLPAHARTADLQTRKST